MNRQRAFRFDDEDFAIIEKHAERLAKATKTAVSHADALRSILHWFRDESPVTMDEIDAHIHAVRKERRLADARVSADKKTILRALEANKGNRTNAAKCLGLSRAGLYQLLDKYELARHEKLHVGPPPGTRIK